MSASKLSLYQGTCTVLGIRKLVSLTENQLSRREFDGVFSRGGVRTCLQFGQFNFAIRTILWDDSPSIPRNFGYQYAFNKPDDWVRTVGVSSDEDFQDPLLDYKDEAGFIFANITPIYFSFVSDHVDYGMDYSKWPENFTRMTEHHFASLTCMRLTQSSAKKAEIDDELKAWKLKAKSTDALDEATSFAPASSWVRARRGGGSRRDRGSRGQLIG